MSFFSLFKAMQSLLGAILVSLGERRRVERAHRWVFLGTFVVVSFFAFSPSASFATSDFSHVVAGVGSITGTPARTFSATLSRTDLTGVAVMYYVTADGTFPVISTTYGGNDACQAGGISIVGNIATGTLTSNLNTWCNGRSELYHYIIFFKSVGGVITVYDVFKLSNLGTRTATDFAIITNGFVPAYNFFPADIDNIFSTSTPSSCMTTVCSLSDVSGCLKEAICWSLVPSTSNMALITSLTLTDRYPFSYISDMPLLYTEIFSVSTTSSVTYSMSSPLGNIPVVSKSILASVPMASTIKLLLGYAIWILLAFGLYEQILKSHNSEQK